MTFKPPPLKLAILISGSIRKYEDNYENIMEKIVQKHNADFFLSHSPELLEENLEDFSRLYLPKVIINEPIDRTIFNLSDYYKNTISMHSNRKRIFKAMEQYSKDTNTYYDYIVNLRLDCYYETVIEYNKIVNNSITTVEELENIVFIPYLYNYGGINDQFAFGKLKPMQVYMSLIDNIETAIEKSKPHVIPEIYLSYYLLQNNISNVKFNFDYYIINKNT